MKIGRRKLMLGAVGALGLAGCGSTGEGTAFSPAAAQLPTTAGQLYVLNAGGGGRTGDVLRLTQVSGRVVFFTDRPARNAGQLSIQEFVAGWTTNGFAADPPNADLQVGVGTQATGYPVELHDPVYDASDDTLTFRITSLDGRQAPAEFGAAVLFIDAGLRGVNGGTAPQPFEVIFQIAGPANQTTTVTLGAEGGDAVFSVGDVLEVIGNGFVMVTQRSFRATSVANATYTVEVAVVPAAGTQAVLLSATGGTVTYTTSTATGTLSATPTRLPVA